MKLNKFSEAIPWIITAILGIALFVVLAVFTLPAFSTASDYTIIGDNFGFNDTAECTGLDLYYLKGSTTVALTISEQRERNWDWVCIMYETASDVWRWPGSGVVLKDSDSDGYIDWLGFTAEGGDTAGGEVRVRWASIENGLPGI